jgi:dCMP deaminase
MRSVISWDKFWCEEAGHKATRSKDPSTQVGCVIVDNDQDIIISGYNGMPQKVKETPEMWTRPLKYDLVLHAELNAIARAAKKGRAIVDATLYSTHFPCNDCAKAIVAAGIRRVVCGPPPTGWDEEHEKSSYTFQIAGVTLQLRESEYFHA